MADATAVVEVLIKGVDQGASGILQAVLRDTAGLSAGTGALSTSLIGTTLAIGGMIEAANLAKDALVTVEEETAKWQTTLVNIANNTNISTQAMNDMGKAALQISTETGAGMETVAGGFEHAYNVTQDYNSALAITKTATESAVSTGANATDVTNLLANAMHEYGLDVSTASTATAQLAQVQDNANQVMGAMHLATAESNTELAAFTESTAKAVGIAANLGVSYNDVFAATAALTKHGFPDVYQAGTQVTDMLTHMMNPSAASKKALDDLAAASGDQGVAQAFTASSLATNGLVGTINLLKKAMDDANMSGAEQEAVMNKIIPALRGGLGAAALTGTAYSDLNKITGDLNDTTKTATITQDSFNRSLETTGAQWDVFKAQAADVAVTVGGPLNGALGGALGTINAIVGGVGTMVGTFDAGFQNASKDSGDFFAEFVQGAQTYVNAINGSTDAIKLDTASLYDWGQAASEAGASAVAAVQGMQDGLSGAMGSAADVAAGQPTQDEALKAQDAARAQVLKDQAAAEKAAQTSALADAKQFYADQATTAKDAATATKDTALAAAQQTLDSTKAEITQEKTAYDDRMAQDIKDRQAQATAALQSLADQNTAANVAAAAANTAEGVKQAAIQRTADESDTAWKAQVTAIKDAATNGETALHTSNDAILKSATDTANDTYNAQVSAIDAEVKAREEGDARDIHSHELASAANIAGIEQEKTAALAAIDQETQAYAAQEAARVKLIDATLAASVKALNDRLAAEKQANTERLAVNAMTKAGGSAAGQELGQFFTATDAQIADTEAALAAKQAGNQALAAQDTQAAATQQATAQALSDQLSAISQSTADQMVQYKIQTDSTITADNVASLTQQATDQKQALSDQLAAEKQSQADKKTATTAFYDGEKAQEQQALADYKWTMAQNLQAFKDAEDAKKATDKATLDTLLANIAIQQTAENARHADAIAKINAKAKADTAAIDLLAQQRKDAATAETAQRNADYTAATAQRAAAYTDAQQKINATSQADIAAMQASQKQADQSFTDRTTAADNYFKDQQQQINTTYQSDINGIAAVQKANTDALATMAKDTTDYANSANGSLSGVLSTIDAINAALSQQAQLHQQVQQAASHGTQYGTGSAGGTGGGVSPFGAPPGAPPMDNGGLGQKVVDAASGWLDSYAYGSGADTFCERFVANMEGRPVQNTAYDAYLKRSGAGQVRNSGDPPPGAEVYFAPDASNEYMGHTGISLGGGMFESVTVDGIRDYSISAWNSHDWGAPFLGWVPAVTPMYASGTDWHPGGAAWVGEDGPELVHLPRGSAVTANDRLGGALGIDYDRLAAALAKQPIFIHMDRQLVGEATRTDQRRFNASSLPNGIGGR